MKRKLKDNPSQVLSLRPWEKKLKKRRQKQLTEPRVKNICFCKDGDMFFEKPNNYQYAEGCHVKRACAIIQRDIHRYKIIAHSSKKSQDIVERPRHVFT